MDQQDHQVGVFSPYHKERIRTGVNCFNNQHYWDCHEVLEEVWLEDRGDSARLIYWAVIQVAAALYHVENKNLIGARGLIAKAREKLLMAEEQKVETPLLETSLNWAYFKSLVRQVPAQPEFEDFKKLYDFRFPEEK